MIKKILIVAIILAVAGIAYWLASPLFIDVKVQESLEEVAEGTTEETTKVISQGEFVGLELHNAEGTAKLIQVGDKFYVRFEEDFKVTNGPDLFVYFGKDGQYVGEARLGRLKGNIGSQNYEVPPGINVENFNEVWIWCRAFSVPFGKAELDKVI